MNCAQLGDCHFKKAISENMYGVLIIRFRRMHGVWRGDYHSHEYMPSLRTYCSHCRKPGLGKITRPPMLTVDLH